MQSFLDLDSGAILPTFDKGCVELSNIQSKAAATCMDDAERLLWWHGGAVIENPFTPRVLNLPHQPEQSSTIFATRRASVGLFRAQYTSPLSTEPQALLEWDGKYNLIPWVDLFSLRSVIRKIMGLPAKNAGDWLYLPQEENEASYELFNASTSMVIPSPLLYTLGRFMYVEDDTLLSQKTAVAKSGVSRFALGRYLEQGQLFGYLEESPKGRRGRRWLIPERSLAMWLEFNRQP